MINNLLHSLSIGVLGAGIAGGAAVLIGSGIYDVAYTVKRRSLTRQKTARRRPIRPLISVIIYSNKQPEQTLECLASLTKSSHRKLQIIVVDNASKDGTAAAIKRFITSHPKKDIRLISKRKHSPLQGVVKAALKAACGELILALEPNHRVERKTLQTAADYFTLTDAEALMPACIIKEAPSLLNLWARFQNFGALSKQKTLSLLSGQGSSFKFGIFYRSELLKRKTMAASGIYSGDVALYYSTKPGMLQLTLGCYGLISKGTIGGFNPLIKIFKLAKLTSQILILPIFLWYSAYLALNSKYVNLLVLSWGLFTFFMIIAIWAIEQLNLLDKLKYVVLSPAMFSVFFVMVYVRAAGLIFKPLEWFGHLLRRKSFIRILHLDASQGSNEARLGRI